MNKKPETPKTDKTTDKPFFARFLEEQELEDVAAGKTLKHPSDGDEDPSDW